MIEVVHLGLRPYREVWQAMRDYTEARDTTSADQLWLVEHPPVYTQGLAGKAEHILNPADIEVIQIDRGGQVTYHGPGQAVIYLLLDLKRAELGVRPLVSLIEHSVIALLADYQIESVARADAPGVYVGEQKIASLGLKIRKGCTYHGLAINVAMDLTPFSGINPCGLNNITMTQIKDHSSEQNTRTVAERCAAHIQRLWQEKTGQKSG
ncbi:lipoyl(octanoyl) transferase LipB [Suttonella sp. R2A3]|uniref:lipoyl(octanoyl) transferase LipB n=1 Tax=Suttonella sp. R2A3 TaxID=2908648 RepID=UPI001F3CB6F0|nr:lipoyl(octanoyl) transferase LipB [Suttonella sp. R2A3]UJF24297.1 lipoyl(octanoyl) transferase LipB [Suttonella sp. R2A3]